MIDIFAVVLFGIILASMRFSAGVKLEIILGQCSFHE